MNDFLTKPVLAERLIAAVQRWTAGTIAESSALSGDDTIQTFLHAEVHRVSVWTALAKVANG